MPNQLAAERSPYLLQHADNPVNWYPWGDEAFREAERRDIPIFLSIGYSTCHWCHVMAHESFESGAIAALLNEHFVPIKVDREERPDVDRVYMTFVQATTGAGGWPMSVWLTPDLKPFYGGTYFPPESRWGRPGFAEILQEISRVWSQERPKVRESANVLTERLRGIRARNPGNAVPTTEALAEGVAEFRRAFDSTRGGFGDAPKFPRPSELLFLLREAARTHDDGPKLMVGRTLYAMALGGMRDHIGGGFHRYSVDAEWRVPHFEKMLYDQAQITLALLEMGQISGDAFFADVAKDTLEYVRREMTNAEGGFLSAEDADSLPPEQAGRPNAHKTEGAFYLWSQAELESLLGREAARGVGVPASSVPRAAAARGARGATRAGVGAPRVIEDDAEIFKLRFGILPHGNAPHDPQGEFTGKNLLYVARSVEDIAAATGRSTADVMAALGRSRMVLFQASLQRPRPHLDDKVLAGWNGLMLAAFARAARVLAGLTAFATATAVKEPRATGTVRLKPDATETANETYLNVAVRSAQFLRNRMWDADRKVLRRRFREGETAIDGYAEDYAFVIFGLLELFQTTGDHAWLGWALELQRRQDELFDDPEGGWFNTTGRDPSVILRLKEDYDGAEPSASSVGIMNLLTLAHLTGDPAMFRKIEATLRMLGPELGRGARAVPMMMAALSCYHAGVRQIVIVGSRTSDDTRALWRAVGQRYDPFSIIVPVEPGKPQTDLGRILPSIESMQMKGGHATAYVCRDFVCAEPVADPSALEAQLGTSRNGGARL